MSTQNIYDLADEWNDAGTTFTAIKMDVTDTNSDAASLLMDLQVGGASKVNIAKDGKIYFGGAPSSTRNAVYSHSTTQMAVRAQDKPFGFSSGGTGAFQMGSAYLLEWTSGTNPLTSSGDLKLARGAANTLAQKNGTNSQTYNIYNTETDASNYERGGLKWSSNVLEIFSEAAGTGTQRDIQLNGANRAAKISDPSGGSTIDSEARTAINSIIDALESHGLSAAA